MATTTYTDSTFAVNAIGGRTDAAGVDVSDYTAEEARFLAQILTEGWLKPSTAFRVAPQDTPSMSVKVGSGTAKADYYVVEGDVGGQGTYVVRLDTATVSVSVPAADASQARTDEVYLVVRDDTYDAGGLGLPRIGYRKGDLGGAAPGPDASWEAYALLATVAVPALETEIEAGGITDERVAAELVESLLAVDTSTMILKSVVDAKGDLIAATAADTVARLPVGTNGQVLTAASAQSTGLQWATISAGPEDADTAVVTTNQSTTSSSYGNLTTAGPSVTVDVGTAGIAMVGVRATIDSFATSAALVAVEISGANTLAAADINSVGSGYNGDGGGDDASGGMFVFTGLNAGSTTFTLKYKSDGSTSNFANRKIGVVTF